MMGRFLCQYRSAFAAALLGLAALSASPGFAQKVYHRGNNTDPGTLDTHLTSLAIEANIIADLHEGLLTLDAKGELAPGVAESWSASSDGTRYTFNLRANAKWSNGDPVKASDFVYSLRRVLNPETRARYSDLLHPIKNAVPLSKGTEKDFSRRA